MPGSCSDAASQIAIPAVPAVCPRGLEAEVVQLFEQLRSPLFRYLFSLGLTAHDGEEVIQEVFLALFQHLQRGRNRDNLRGWVFRVAHNLGLKQRMLLQRGFQDMEESLQMPDPGPNPEERLATSQRQARLIAVVRALPEQDQYCLYLRAEGLRYREIAHVLGVSLGTVSNSLGRSLGRLGRADER
jgi:RNA polymerase sigma-70 factor, ECF subfamily